MAEPIYVSAASIEKVKGVHRRAYLDAGPTLDFGVHGPIKEYYNLFTERDHALPVDFVVAATGG